jgi:CHAD domain-containing protein
MMKWLPDVAPNNRAVDVAARSLESRLGAVRFYFKRAAERPDEPENIRQLRVWVRRSEAALAVYADLLPPRRLKQLRKMLGQVRRAAGRVRDCDVYAQQTVGPGQPWPRRLREDRAKAQRRLVARFNRLDRGRSLKRLVRRLRTRLRGRNAGETESFADRARRTLRELAVGFFEIPIADGTKDAALHQFRIRGKELRYAIELLAAAFPPAFRDEVYPQVGVLQDKLGLVNDLAVAEERLRKRSDRTGDPAELSELRRRSAETAEDLVQARDDFRRWWTPDRVAELRRRFEELCDPDNR